MKDDKLTLLTQEAVAAEEVVRKDAQTALEQAHTLVPKTDADFERRQRALQRAQSLISLVDHLNAKA